MELARTCLPVRAATRIPRDPLRAHPVFWSAPIDLAALLLAPQLFTRDVPISQTVAVLVILILSLAVHEVAHAWVAWKRGDPTAKNLGRITLDPLPHIDLWWTILLPSLLWFGSGGRFIFGGAKPVPVVFQNLKRPYPDMALVAVAGPLSNVAIAVLFELILKIVGTELQIWNSAHIGWQILDMGVQLNLILAVFNLLPIPPLDGSRIMNWLLPESLREGYMRLESIGFLLIMFFLWGLPQISNPLILNSMTTLRDVVRQIVTVGGLW